MRAFSVTAIVIILTTQAAAHSGGLNKQGCHAGSQPYHCHKRAKVEPLASSNSTILNGTVFGALQEAACARRHNNLSDYEEVEKILRKIEAALGVTESQITSFVDTHNDERKLNKYWCSVWALVDAETKDEKERNKQTLFAMVHKNSTIEQLAIKAVGDLKVMWLCIDLRLTKICLDNRWTYEEPQRTGSNLDNDTAIIKDLCNQHTPEVVLKALRGGEATAFPIAEKLSNSD